MHTETPDLLYFDTKHAKPYLSEEQLKKLKEGTLHLLEEVGVLFPSQKALEIFVDHGAKVDMESQIVRIPSDLVLKAMSTAPRSFLLGGRENRFDLLLDGSRTYICTDGCGTRVIDPETRELRPSKKADVERLARISDALPMISFFWPLVSAQDHGITAPLHECHAGLTNTLKHVRGGTTVFAELAPYIVEMATVVAGSDEERRRRPPVCGNICTIAPLTQDVHGIETALVFAEAGIPTSFMAMTTMGSTAPATPLGALVQGDAEAVSAMVLMQLAYPGAPVFHSCYVSLMDPQTGGYIGKVGQPVGKMATDLAHAWNVPSLGVGSVSSDAEVIGWRSGVDAMSGAVAIPLGGAEVCGYLGMLDSSMLQVPENLILDHEICMEVYEYYQKFDFDEHDMALEVIQKVGPKSHFLREKHTRKHIRDFRLSKVLRKQGPDGDPLSPELAAFEEFNRLNADHHPKPLPEDSIAELDRILAAAEREAENLEI
jgi:trimethylamine--corrinoid protein Co-methyltransferase